MSGSEAPIKSEGKAINTTVAAQNNLRVVPKVLLKKVYGCACVCVRGIGYKRLERVEKRRDSVVLWRCL